MTCAYWNIHNGVIGYIHFERHVIVETQITSIDALQDTAQSQIEHWNDRVDGMKELKNRVADIANTIEQLESLNQKLGLLNDHNN